MASYLVFDLMLLISFGAIFALFYSHFHIETLNFQNRWQH